MIFNSKFDTQEINRERGVIIEEINMYMDNPIMFIDSFLEEEVFKGHDLGRQIIGTKEVVKKISRAEIMKFYRKYYQSENMVIGVAGNFLEKKAQNLINKYFKIKNFNQQNDFSKFKIQQKKTRIILQKKDTDQVHLSLGFLGLSYKDQDYYAYQLLSVILGGTMSSRLFVRIREKLGLCYYIRAHSESFQDTGIFSITAGLDKNRIDDALKAIFIEIEKIKTKGVSVTELKRAKKYIQGRLTIRLEDSSNIIAWYVDQLVLKNRQLDLKEILERFNKVEINDIFRVVNKIFRKNRLNLAVIGPINDKKKLENILVSFNN